MEVLEDNIRKRNFKEVLQQCEEGEILNPSGYATTEVYMIMLGCYLATDELVHAKFLWTRIPDIFKRDNPVLGNLWNVTKTLKERDIAKFQEAMTETCWPENYTTLIDVIIECVTERRTLLISKSYSAIHIVHMGKLLGLSPEKAKSISCKLGWSVDEGTGVVTPVIKRLEQMEVVKGKEIIEHLSKYVSFLEN
ncbi:COP9 signalosome complex subunit 8 [Oopsacas minuta]|uniref:COP9 signalosome complex subunit 8 n=1 Tax=Oopsacas minuta TaxID=111878 RepID=A0AAV7JQL7_9METZ|nr:COP9 signalosome complex subunit 8 [Oopsacas minuta]